MNRRSFISGLLASAAATTVPRGKAAKTKAGIGILTWHRAIDILAENRHDHMIDAMRYGFSMWRTTSDGRTMKIDPAMITVDKADFWSIRAPA